MDKRIRIDIDKKQTKTHEEGTYSQTSLKLEFNYEVQF
jgi:hypothetical protein